MLGKYKNLFIFFFVSWLVLCIFVFVVLNFVDLPLGTRIGRGIFLLKGYYEETIKIGGMESKTIVTEQGLGVYTVPLVTSLFLTMIYGFFKYIDKREVKNDRM